MSNWRKIFVKSKYALSVGMWVETSSVCFTFTDQSDYEGGDFEIELTIPELEQIIKTAKIYEGK